ncbi:MAG TPA: hypothetical protein VEX18_03550 [Polyangiaceae bacterium]|nr:hypothetical protein [Polyangiaceae bacterium]
MALAGCGSDDAPPKQAGGGSGGSSAGSSQGGAPVTGGVNAGGMTGGSTATAGSGTGGSSLAGSGSCHGPYGQPLLVLAEEPDALINGISLTADERELYYSREKNAMQEVVRRTRASAGDMFGAVEPLPALAGVCGDLPNVNPDISEDGLTLYVTCTAEMPPGMSEGVSPLRVARRADRSSDFTLEAEPIGNVFASAGISADELTAYTDGEFFGTAPQMFTRATKAEAFSGPMEVPEIRNTGLRSLDISSDGLSLFGAVMIDEVTRIARAHRETEGAAFSEPVPLDLPLDLPMMPVALGVGAPNVTAGCLLYMIVRLMDGQYTVYRASPT